MAREVLVALGSTLLRPSRHCPGLESRIAIPRSECDWCSGAPRELSVPGARVTPAGPARRSSARSALGGWATSSARNGRRSSWRSRSTHQGARGGPRPRSPGGPPGSPRKQTLADRSSRRSRASASARSPARAREERRGRCAHRRRGTRRSLRRRDPPSQPGRGGDPLPGARGLPVSTSSGGAPPPGR